jgi:hypothetical protein
VYARIPGERAPGTADDAAPFAAGVDYARIWLSEIYLSSRRRWFTGWNPAVHSLVRLQYGERSVELPQIIGEVRLAGLDQDHLDRVVRVDVPLTGFLPFHGGTIELAAGLLALPGDRGISGFVNVLGGFGKLLAVPQLTAALEIAEPLADGIQQLIVATNGGLHLGLHQTFSASGGGDAHALRAGYVAVVRTDAGRFDASRLWVVDGRLMSGADAAALGPFTGDDFLLFHIEKRSERDDWEGFTNIIGPFNESLDALADGLRERADSLLRGAVVAVLKSADLTAADRRRVATVLKERYQEALDAGLGAARPDGPVVLSELVSAGMNARQAAALGAPTFEELFGE